MTQHYKHPCKNPFQGSAGIHQPKTQIFSELLDGAAKVAARGKQSPQGSGALTVLQTTMLQKGCSMQNVIRAPKPLKLY